MLYTVLAQYAPVPLTEMTDWKQDSSFQAVWIKISLFQQGFDKIMFETLRHNTRCQRLIYDIGYYGNNLIPVGMGMMSQDFFWHFLEYCFYAVFSHKLKQRVHLRSQQCLWGLVCQGHGYSWSVQSFSVFPGISLGFTIFSKIFVCVPFFLAQP